MTLPPRSSGPDALLVSALWADDVAHELAAPIAFFEQFIGGIVRGAVPDEEQLSVASEELDHLVLVLKSLRQVKSPAIISCPQRLGDLLLAAASACECACKLNVVPQDLQIQVDESYVPHGLAPLLRAYGRAADPTSEVRIDARRDVKSGAVTITIVAHVVDVAEGGGKVLFAGDVWTAAAAGRSSLAVLLAKRVLRAHGHRVSNEVVGSTQTLDIRIPAT